MLTNRYNITQTVSTHLYSHSYQGLVGSLTMGLFLPWVIDNLAMALLIILLYGLIGNLTMGLVAIEPWDYCHCYHRLIDNLTQGILEILPWVHWYSYHGLLTILLWAYCQPYHDFIGNNFGSLAVWLTDNLIMALLAFISLPYWQFKHGFIGILITSLLAILPWTYSNLMMGLMAFLPWPIGILTMGWLAFLPWASWQSSAGTFDRVARQDAGQGDVDSERNGSRWSNRCDEPNDNDSQT